ncbi:hypothetical protein CEN49_16865, partial [Fischerella thermalis CCMEE 5273]
FWLCSPTQAPLRFAWGLPAKKINFTWFSKEQSLSKCFQSQIKIGMNAIAFLSSQIYYNNEGKHLYLFSFLKILISRATIK